MSDTKLSLKEAAESVADLFQFNPETYTQMAYYRTPDGTPIYGSRYRISPLPASVACFCAVGGVALAAGVTLNEASDFLSPFAKGHSPEYTNNLGIKRAINMLRRAAK